MKFKVVGIIILIITISYFYKDNLIKSFLNQKHWDYDIADDEIVVYNPFKPTYDDFYHFTVDTNTATSGGVSGGGNSCSAGPATLED